MEFSQHLQHENGYPISAELIIWAAAHISKLLAELLCNNAASVLKHC